MTLNTQAELFYIQMQCWVGLCLFDCSWLNLTIGKKGKLECLLFHRPIDNALQHFLIFSDPMQVNSSEALNSRLRRGRLMYIMLIVSERQLKKS